MPAETAMTEPTASLASPEIPACRELWAPREPPASVTPQLAKGLWQQGPGRNQAREAPKTKLE